MSHHPKFTSYIIGEGTLLIQCAEILLQREQVVLGVITGNPAIQDWASAHKIRVIHPKSDLVAELSQQPFDYFFSIANLSIIPDEVLTLAGRAAINFHDGPLPRYAGLYATSWALMNQEEAHGVSWHLMGGDVDTGDILKQRIFEIEDRETAFTLNAKCYDNATQTFEEMVDDILNDRVEYSRQDLSQRNYFGKFHRPANAGIISWQRTAQEIDALVRAFNFSSYANPIAVAKLYIGNDVLIVGETSPTSDSGTPGTILEVNDDFVTVAAGDGAVQLRKLSTIDGQGISIKDFVARYALKAGDQLPEISSDVGSQLSTLNEALSHHEEYWLNRLYRMEPVELPYANRGGAQAQAQYTALAMPILPEIQVLGQDNPGDFLMAIFSAFAARISGTYSFDLSFSDLALHDEIAGFEALFATRVPLHINLDMAATSEWTLQTLLKQIATVRKRKTYTRDLTARFPELAPIRERGGKINLPVAVEQVETIDSYSAPENTELALLVSADGSQCWWVYNNAVFDDEAINTLQRQFSIFMRQIAADTSQAISQISILDDAEYRQLIVEWNDTETEFPRDLCVHQIIEKQAEQTPFAIAAAFEDREITYRELNTRANQLAHHLRKLGVGPDVMVGLYMERSIEMMIGLLAVHKAGGAYVPLDPTYPADRIAYMIEDSQAPVLLTQKKLLNDMPAHQAQMVCIDADWATIARESQQNPVTDVRPQNLCYVIYTSGSTGKPKGVMIEHRNVVNFFAAMDDRLKYEQPGVWLAVTSLSFDISVLELFWTLARGFKVVIYADTTKSASPAAVNSPYAHRPIDFSLFYFASDEGANAADKYEALLEGAKFADTHSFAAVWTPERHFYAFGGLYPNPSVASAAIAAITRNVKIRAGSCVLPLHSPIRVAEEWALVDNLSKGRVGISFAAGWQPNDFVLRPDNFADRKNIMFRDIETVRKLWRGETLMFPGANGNEYPVRTLPRPVQPELPVWVTIAGNPETYRMAGEGGFQILTHLLGQSPEELAEKLNIYRQAWRDAGHAGEGYVTLMLHTFVGDDLDQVREVVRQPMKNYLRDAMDLVEKAAWHFPAFKQRAQSSGQNLREMFASEAMSAEEKDAILDFAFERYFVTSGLFGTPESCLDMVNKLKEMHIDEIACLIDFGIETPLVLKHLDHLNRLRELASPVNASADNDYSIPALVARHKVTHLQCTPSMAGMLTINEDSRTALASLQKLMVGGEAFPLALAKDLEKIVARGDVINMYGPTETTIWSSTHPVKNIQDVVSIGKPFANTSMYIVDKNLQPVPVGVPGELLIGGAGVVRGYLHRPELTAERFVPDHFSSHPGARMYRTGDLARFMPDGNIEFLGRIDHQVKIRGYRIELGEIEALLDQHPQVRKAVVIAREDVPGDKRLVGYIIPSAKPAPASTDLRAYLKESLPEFMVPAHIVAMDSFPQTPNGKVDRKALPAPDQVKADTEAVYVPPQSDLEEKIAGVWRQVLNIENVGVNDNFFDLGGHSLLSVQAHRLICQFIDKPLSMTDMFRFPTVRALSDYLSGDDNGKKAVQQQSVNRAEDRRKALMERNKRRG
jgi:natural product biosynthesis luciferase-like monooxygenase protein